MSVVLFGLLCLNQFHKFVTQITAAFYLAHLSSEALRIIQQAAMLDSSLACIILA